MILGDRTFADDTADELLEIVGKPARYFPSDGSAQFDLVVSFNPGAGATTTVDGEDLADITPQALGNRFALAAATSEDQIEVAGARWLVERATPDGGGFVALRLAGPI